MLAYRILARSSQKNAINPSLYKGTMHFYSTKSSKSSSSSSSSSSSDSDNEMDKKKQIKKDSKLKSEEALNKLNVLLKQMIEDDTQVSSKSDLNLAKPKSRVRNDKAEPGTMSAKSEPVEKRVIYAAKDVAESLGGNVKQTESELLSKLLTPTANSQEDSSAKSATLSDLISGMKIDRTAKPAAHNNEASRAHQVRKLLDRTSGRTSKDYGERGSVSQSFRKPKITPKSEIERIDLFGAEPLGVFTNKTPKSTSKQPESITLKTWNALQERELRLAVTHPPENYFQEMILWTQQGKVWKFPIDNEQGLEEEQSVYFAEHVFLDKHLEPWCPTKGPIRHFMELVCVGLSKNPYLTAQAKKDHILWFKDYFLSKQQLLEEIGAMPTKASKVDQIAEK